MAVLTSRQLLSLLLPLGDNAITLPKLVEQVQSPLGVVPFIGAGMSVPFQFPQWGEFLERLAPDEQKQQEIRAQLKAGRYEEAAQELMEWWGTDAFQDAVDHAFGPARLEGKELKGAVCLLPRLAEGPVLTTNFDGVLERVFAAAGNPFERVILGMKTDFIRDAFNHNLRCLIKLHGDAADRTDRVLTRREYETRYGTAEPLRAVLEFAMRHPLLFLGCSLQQDRTVQVLESLHQGLDVVHYAILEVPADSLAFTQRRRSMSERGIRVVWFPTKEFELIEALLNYLADEAGRGSVGRIEPLATRMLTPADAPYFASEVYRLLEKRLPPDDLKPCEDMTRWLASPDPDYFGYFIIAELHAHPVGLLYLHRRAGVPYAFVSYLVVRNEPGPERQSLDKVSSSLLTEVMRQMKRPSSGLDDLRGFLVELAHPATAPNADERTERVARFRRFETLAAANGFQLHAIDVGYLQPPLSVEENQKGIPHLLLLARRREPGLPQQLSRAEASQILKHLYLDLYPSSYSDDPCENDFIRETCARMLATVTANLPDEVRLLGYRHFAPR